MQLKSLDDLMVGTGRSLLAGAPDGVDALALADLARRQGGEVLHVARDEGRMARMAESLAFFAPEIEVVEFPGWDCVPYDRVSPHIDVVARRIDALTRLAQTTGQSSPRIVVTTVGAVLQRVPPRDTLERSSFAARSGEKVSGEALISFLSRNGYVRSDTVMEPGEYAVRGGIIDLFPPGTPEPLRLDFFGDELDSVRSFDPMTQRTTGKQAGFALEPVSEVLLDEVSIARFRSGYREMFGIPSSSDPLYESISSGIKFTGMEHWLPLFQERMDTLFDYLGDAPIAIEPQSEDATTERFKQIADYYDARREALEHPGGGAIYKPLPPDRLYLTEDEWKKRLQEAAVARLTPFAIPEGSADTLDAGARQGRNFAPERNDSAVNVFEAIVAHVQALQAERKKVVIALWSEGSRDRMESMLRDHKLLNLTSVNTWRAVQATPRNQTMLAVVGMEAGFETDQVAVITEQDILGDRLVRPRKASRKLDNFISEVTSLATGDIVVHVEHGIGRFVGLQTLDVAGAPHD